MEVVTPFCLLRTKRFENVNVLSHHVDRFCSCIPMYSWMLFVGVYMLRSVHDAVCECIHAEKYTPLDL